MINDSAHMSLDKCDTFVKIAVRISERNKSRM